MWNDAGLSEVLTINHPDTVQPWEEYPYMVSGNGWIKEHKRLDEYIDSLNNVYPATDTVYASKDKLLVTGAKIKYLRIASGLGMAAAKVLGYDLDFDTIQRQFNGQNCDILSMWQASQGGKTGLTIVNFGLHKDGSTPLATAIDHNKTFVIYKDINNKNVILDDEKIKGLMFPEGNPSYSDEPVQAFGIDETTFIVKSPYDEVTGEKIVKVLNRDDNSVQDTIKPVYTKKYKLNIFKIDPDEGLKKIESINGQKHQLDFVVGEVKGEQRIEYTGDNLYFMDDQGQTMVATPEGFKKLFDWNPVLRKDARTVNPLKLIASVRDNRTFVIPVDNGERGISFQVIDYLQDLGDDQKGNFYFKQNLPTIGVGNFKLKPNLNSFPILEQNQVQSGAYVLASGTQDGGFVHVVYKFDNSGNAVEWAFEQDKGGIFSKKNISNIKEYSKVQTLINEDTTNPPHFNNSINLNFKAIEYTQISPPLSNNNSDGTTEPRYSTQPTPNP